MRSSPRRLSYSLLSTIHEADVRFGSWLCKNARAEVILTL